MRKLIMSAIAALGVAGGMSGTAMADRCKDVHIHVDNEFQEDGQFIQIKVVDMDYWDDDEGKWREESAVPNLVADPHENIHLDERNLEYVGGQSGTVIRVQFRYMTESNGWSEILDAESSEFTCTDSKLVTVTVN